jgi:hypothetical protein
MGCSTSKKKKKIPNQMGAAGNYQKFVKVCTQWIALIS